MKVSIDNDKGVELFSRSETPFLSQDKESNKPEMKTKQKRNLAIFYCQNVAESSDNDRRILEKEYGQTIRFFPVACAGRLDYVHFLKALEEFADAAYVITCPEGACHYFEGNRRAVKRVQRARSIVESIGLEKERLEIVMASSDNQKGLRAFCEELVERASVLDPSPVHKSKGERNR